MLSGMPLDQRYSSDSPFSCADAKHRHDFGDQGMRRAAQPLDFQTAGLDLGKVQDVVDQAHEVFAAGVDGIQIFLTLILVVPSNPFAEKVRESEDRVQRGADLVAHVGQELALGDIGRLGRFLGFPKLAFEAEPLGDVSSYEDESARVSGLAPDRCTGDVNWHETAVAGRQRPLAIHERCGGRESRRLASRAGALG